MAIFVDVDKPAFPSSLFSRLVSCFPIRPHAKYSYCMFEDDMKATDSNSQVAAMLDELRDHFLKQGWEFQFEEELTMVETVKILRQAVSFYGYITGRNQTTLCGIPRRYIFITKGDVEVQGRPFNALKVQRKRISLTF
jgi:hypothetical protein